MLSQSGLAARELVSKGAFSMKKCFSVKCSLPLPFRLTDFLLPILIVFAGLFAAACDNPVNSSPKTYTIVFDSHGGSAVPPVTGDEGAPVPKPSPDPAKDGCTFLGWFSAETGGTQYTWPHTLTANVTMHAQWQENGPPQYTITFNTHGDTAVGAVTQNAGTTVSRPDPDPEKTGYTFLGWYSEETGGTLYAWPHTLTASITMHAHWWDDNNGPPPAQYTIGFDSHGGTDVAAIPAYAGAAIAKPAPDPARTDYSFTGWYSEETGGTMYAWPHTLTADITMHAQWQAVPTYTITFESHGGTNVAAITQYEGTPVSKPTPDPAKGGYTFTGWFSEETGGAPYTWPHTLTGNLTMHAQWQDNSQTQYTIGFNTHGGSNVAAITQNAGTPVSKPTPDPAKSGYSFAGWFNAETGGTVYTWPHTLTASLTMHAQWWENSQSGNKYTVTFHISGGSPAPEPQSVAAGGNAAEPAVAVAQQLSI
jgi:uncharacterized repeat protein (TIGR02543 family)